MPSDLEFTGERYLPGVEGEIAHEHWHRYAFARRFAAGRRVLDVACGEGYGSALLSLTAAEVVGVDIDEAAVAHAQAAYRGCGNLRYLRGSASVLPLPDAAVDLVVSFETVEHLPREEQPRMIAEIARVCAPGGIVILSAPNPAEYSQARDYVNPFHLHEPSREELAGLVAPAFGAQRWYRQRRYFGSALWREQAGSGAFEALTGEGDAVRDAAPPPAMYYLLVAARSEQDLPGVMPALSLFADSAESELRRVDEQAREVMRLDALLKSRDTALDRQAGHVLHLEQLVAHRERVVEQRDAELARAIEQRATAASERDSARADTVSARQAFDAMAAECARLERALCAQERIIAYRQSLRWWLALPWLRLKLLLQHVRGR